MIKKYELLETERHPGNPLFRRIKYLRDLPYQYIIAGELGGWLESEENLSQDGEAVVISNAVVFGNARVSGDALVGGNSRVFGDAQVFSEAYINGNALVFGTARVGSNIKVTGDAVVGDRAALVNIVRLSGGRVEKMEEDAHAAI